MQDLEGKNSALTADVARHEGTIADLQSKLHITEEKLKVEISKRESLETALEALRGEHVALQARLAAAHAEIEHQAGVIEQLTHDKSKLARQFSKSANLILSVKSNNHEVISQLGSDHELDAEQRQAAADLKATIERLTAQLQQTTHELLDTSSRLVDTQALLERTQTELATLDATTTHRSALLTKFQQGEEIPTDDLPFEMAYLIQRIRDLRELLKRLSDEMEKGKVRKLEKYFLL